MKAIAVLILAGFAMTTTERTTVICRNPIAFVGDSMIRDGKAYVCQDPLTRWYER